MPHRLALRLVVLAALASNACLSDVQDLDWRLVFASAADATAASAVEVCIVEGPCPSVPVRCEQGPLTRYRADFPYDGGVMPGGDAVRPPQLPRGHYAFVARARDARCRVIATGCTDLDTPATGAEVTLETASTISAECCGAACRDGVCPEGDAGPACEDDDDPCTVVGCDDRGACVQQPLTDGSACPGPDPGECRANVCRSGVCGPEAAFEGRGCTSGDDNPCTEFLCRAGACVGEATAALEGTDCREVDADPCTLSRCVSGTCTALPDARTNGERCTTANADPCLDPVCSNGACVEAIPVVAGTPCGDDWNPCTTDVCDASGTCVHPAVPDSRMCAGDPRHRCCGGVCRDTFEDEQHCGGCGLACAPPNQCRNVGGNPRGTTCDCARDMDCPGTSGAWTCSGNVPPPGRCTCNSSVACPEPLSCNTTPRGDLCVYRDF